MMTYLLNLFQDNMGQEFTPLSEYLGVTEWVKDKQVQLLDNYLLNWFQDNLGQE